MARGGQESCFRVTWQRAWLAQLLHGTKHATASKRIRSYPPLCSVQAVSDKRWHHFNRRRAGSLRLLNFFGIIFHLWSLVATNSAKISPRIFFFKLDNKLDKFYYQLESTMIVSGKFTVFLGQRIQLSNRVARMWCEFQNSANWYKHLFRSFHRTIKHWTFSTAWLSDPTNIRTYISLS